MPLLGDFLRVDPDRVRVIPLGIAMGNFKGPLGDTLYNTHKSLGMLILVLMVARLGYRHGHGGACAGADAGGVAPRRI